MALWPSVSRLEGVTCRACLFLSRRGVCKHVANVFTKLGFDSDDDNRRVRAVPDSSAPAMLLRVEHAHLGEGLFLADLGVDIDETSSLAGQRPEIVTRLTAAHVATQCAPS